MHIEEEGRLPISMVRVFRNKYQELATYHGMKEPAVCMRQAVLRITNVINTIGILLRLRMASNLSQLRLVGRGVACDASKLFAP